MNERKKKVVFFKEKKGEEMLRIKKKSYKC